MNALLIFLSVVALTSAQYDYTPPERDFNAGGNGNSKDKPTYGLPGHTPGTPQGLKELGSAPSASRNGNQGGYSTAQAPVRAQQAQQAQFSRPSTPNFAAPAPIAPVRAQVQAQQAFEFSRPAPQQRQQFSAPIQAPIRQQQQQGQQQQQEQQEEVYTPQVFRHVYVHVAPDEPADVQSRTIRVPGGDKHVNIIFVKTPSQDSQQQTEVILPEQDEHKNLVYVLLKKGEASSDVKIRRPAPVPQKKPEVYFIKYADQAQQISQQQNQQQNQGQQQSQNQGQQQQQQQQSSGGNGGGYEQAPIGILAPAPIRSSADVPSSGYGTPF